jgi:hypothetical protein
LVDLILAGLLRYLFDGSSFMLKSPANCWMSSFTVYWMFLGFRLNIDLRFTSLMMIFVLEGKFWFDLADVARLKNLFLLFEVDFCEFLEQLLTCDFLSDLLER